MINQKSAIKVGVVALISLILISILLVWKSGIFVRAAGYQLIGEFNNVQGLLNGAQVRYRGYAVGYISTIEPGPKNIRAYFWLFSGIKVPRHSTLRIVFDGLVGERYIDIKPPEDPKLALVMAKPGDVLTGFATSGLADFVDVGTRTLEETKRILTIFRQIVASQNVQASMAQALIETGQITHELRLTLTQVREATSDDNLLGVVTNLREMTNELHKNMSIMLKDGQLGSSVRDTAKNMASITRHLNDITTKIEKGVLDQSVLTNIDTTIRNLARLSTDLNAVLSDKAFQADLKGAVGETREFLKKSNGLVGSAGKLGMSGELNIEQHQLSTPLRTYELNMNFKNQEQFWRVGFGDKADSTLKLTNLQQGFSVSDRLNARMGLMNTEPGVGLDYMPVSAVQIGADLYNLNTPQLDIKSRLKVMDNVDVLMGVNAVQSEANRNLSVGVSVHSAERQP